MSLSLSLRPRVFRTYDADVVTYIGAVETADGQSLEQGVKEAINEFVIGCKIRGIWNAIKSCCLLCGARTLNGALIPLKGPSPTNFNFITTDYDRKTGLIGNASNKYLNTNFDSASPLVGQDNFHFSIFISSTNTGIANATYIADGGRNMYRTINTVNNTQFNINASFGAGGGDRAMAIATGFCGLSRNNGQNFTIRVDKSNRVYSAASTVESTSGLLRGTFRIFGRNGNLVMQEFSNGRLSLYTIGENIDLQLLEQCIENHTNILGRLL